MTIDITALFSWKTTAVPVGWGFGYCPYCDQVMPIRAENETRSFCFALIPIKTEMLGQLLRCDFCQRLFEGRLGAPPIPLAQWSPSDGVARLVDVLRIADQVDSNHEPAESALRSLLQAADEQSSFESLDVGNGLIAGAVLGTIGGGLFAVIGYKLGFTLGEMDAIGTAICVPLLAIVGCSILAPLLQAVVHRRTVPRQVLERGVREYQFDTMELQRLSEEYSSRTRAAANRVR